MSVDRPYETRRTDSSVDIAIIADGDVARRRAAAVLSGRGMRAVSSYTSIESFVADPASAIDAVVVWCNRISAKNISMLRRVKRRLPAAPIVVVLPSVRRSIVADGLAAGVDGFVLARNVDACLAPAVESALGGQISLPRELSTAVARPALSVREKQTLALVVMGFSNAEIAKRLFVSESTVKSHLSSAFDRLGVRSRSEAAAMILDPESGLGAGILTISNDERRRARGST